MKDKLYYTTYKEGSSTIVEVDIPTLNVVNTYTVDSSEIKEMYEILQS